MLGYYVEGACLVAAEPVDEGTRAGTGLTLRLLVVCALLGGGLLAWDLIVRGFFENPTQLAHARGLARIMALLPLLEAFTGMGVVVLQRRLVLRGVVVCQAFQPLVYSLLGLVLLGSGQGIIGLAWAQIAGASTSLAAVLFLMTRTGRLNLVVSWTALGVLGRESLRQALAGIVGFLTEKVDNLLVAGTLGPTALSYYSFAWTASRLPISIFSRIARAVFLPVVVAKERGEPRARILESGLRMALPLSFWIGSLVAIRGSQVLTLVLGNRWIAAGHCLEIMAGTIALSPLLFFAATAIQASGLAHRLGPLAGGTQLALQLLLIPVAVRKVGERGAAVVDVLAFLGATVVVLAGARRVGGPSLVGIRRGLGSCLASSAVTVAGFLSLPSPPSPTVGILLASLLLATVSYFSVLGILDRRLLTELVSHLKAPRTI